MVNLIVANKKTSHIIFMRCFILCLSDFSNEELVVLSSTLAISLSKDFCQDDLIILATFFTTLGDNLAILSLS